MKKGIIDRLEEKAAVCEWENRMTERIPFEKFPQIPEEGDVIAQADGRIHILSEETKQRRKKMEYLFESLKKKKEQ